ncbi:hypothetical protein [Campylobacter pinnipediorum]|uniref:Uncharacterized protein n=1 Tax=Campylobacter pinnipediorum subsp. pinnipediorum TaxID=1660067 RepID=A0AAX0LBG7_9BACT|nr:hypothetical protein [Campylobacter pinnipediorum]AQW81566.1 hypothetical protein CPIN17260_1281 [Campylobacter pinnipediorum subsp. pinnipediorum]AQW83194.1 hypothetical protein CPIN17261_1194 [Campylobacter pinnipediorum subsp. pinnipediorum]AQW84762.1 hypothetical protein CPIN17262_1086 [Campylobacter pinnipediorum subsp. pinnipediorum]OPA79626.1 hypothetical protein BFG05_00525 [Campylobacter pinnipediorum subsp. pinnipediorum]OPA81771.1 hypothetical protein BFG04_01115 [Campylobacter p
MNDITIAFLISIAVAFALYMQIQKMTQNIDMNEALNGDFKEDDEDKNSQLLSEDKTDKYKSFCDEIDKQIRDLRQKVKDNDLFISDDVKDEFMAELSQLSRKLTFIQNMNTKKDAKSWEKELFDILSSLENSIQKSLKNPDEINENIRENLKESFSKL